MGNASKKKWEQRQLKYQNLCNVKSNNIDHFPQAVYRYFDKPEFADDFVNGSILLSTLEICRKHEGDRGDSGEGTAIYNSGSVFQDLNPIGFKQIEQNLGGLVSVQDCVGAQMHDCQVTTKVPDALVLCTTATRSNVVEEKFGPYCVKIENLIDFLLN